MAQTKTVEVPIPEQRLRFIARAALRLIAEIEKRDGEGNTIPDYLYSSLKAQAQAALAAEGQ